MKNFKRVAAIVLSVVLCFSMASCGKKEASKDTATQTTESTADASPTGASTKEASTAESADNKDPSYDTHEKISIALWGIGDAITDGDDAVRDAVYKKFNIEVEPFPVTWGDYTEKIKLWAASNSLPDMTAYEAGFTSMFDDWTTQGVVRALPKDMSKYPNVKALLESDYGKSVNKITDATTDPVYYAVPRPSYKNEQEGMADYGIMIRKDWMEKVGVTKVPDNLDDLISLCKKFQTDDPDGNGIDDTIGLTGYTYAWMTSVFSGTNPMGEGGFRWVFSDANDGTLTQAWATQAGLEGFRALKKVYDAGIMDPDYIVLKGEEGRDKFKNGIAGAYCHSGPGLFAIKTMEDQFVKKYPDKTIDQIIAFCPLFANKDGKVEYVKDNSCWSETYLGANCSDEKAERCMALLDYLLSDEGYRQVSLGFEGTDYTVDANGKITMTEQKKADGSALSISEKYKFSAIQSLAHWSGYRSADSPVFTEVSKKMQNDYFAEQVARGAVPARRPDTNGLVLTETSDYENAWGEFSQVCNDMMTSKDLDATWKAWVDKTMNELNFKKCTEEMTKLYKESGRQ